MASGKVAMARVFVLLMMPPLQAAEAADHTSDYLNTARPTRPREVKVLLVNNNNLLGGKPGNRAFGYSASLESQQGKLAGGAVTDKRNEQGPHHASGPTHAHDHSHAHSHTHTHGHSHDHSHGHDHEHGHVHQHVAEHNHVSAHSHGSRRDFLRVLAGGVLSGASLLELAYHRAAWARSAPASDAKLFDIQKVADGVYFAHARPQALLNCNAAIFVRSKDVVVVDAHSKPSAAAGLIQQIQREVTEKQVRYVVNTHFHWDHTQGDHAYRMTGHPVDFIASSATKQLMSDLAVARMKESVEAVPQQIDALRTRAAHSSSAAEKAFCADQIAQMQAYQNELKNYTLELPTITFDKSYLLRDSAFDLHLDFHGHSHTAGDVFVFCPQERAMATGDAIHGFLPNIADGFPRSWPGTIDAVGAADFQFLMGGHGPLQRDRTVMRSQRNYIEELTEKVADGKKAGLTLAEMQQRMTVASLKSLQSNGYAGFLVRISEESDAHFGKMPPLQDGVNTNIHDVYKNLDRV
jgi:cyclase